MRAYASILVILTSLISFSEVQSQLTFGPKVGINAATISGGDFDPRLRFYGGGFANLHFASYRFALQGEVLVIAAGARGKDEGSITNVQNSLSYLSVPLGLRIRLWQRFHFGGGIQYSVLASASTQYDIDGKGRDLDVSEFYKSTDYGVYSEFGFQGYSGLGFSFRFYRGLSNMWDGGGTNKYHNTYLQAGFYYAFGNRYQ